MTDIYHAPERNGVVICGTLHKLGYQKTEAILALLKRAEQAERERDAAREERDADRAVIRNATRVNGNGVVVVYDDLEWWEDNCPWLAEPQQTEKT